MRISLKYQLLLLPFVFWALLPVLSYSLPIRGLVAVSLLLILIRYFMLAKDLRYVVVMVLSLVIMWTLHTYASPDMYKNKFIHYSFFVIVSFLALHVFDSSRLNASFIIRLILVLNSVTAIVTLRGYTLNANISRILSEMGEVSRELSALGYGGYGFVYMNVTMLPLILFYFKKANTFYDKTIALTAATLSVVLILKAQYTYALVLTIISLIIIAYKTINKIWAIFIVPVLLILLSSFFTLLTDYQSLLSGTRYLGKMNDVMAVLNGGSSNGLLSSRVNAYQASVIGFIENPIIGVLDFSSKKIGKHSEFVDKLAQFGLLGFALIWNIIRSSWKFAKTSGYLEFKISLVLLLIIGLVNTISLEFSVTVIAGGALLKLYDK